MSTFRIGDIEFGIGSVEAENKNDTVTIGITTDDEKFEKAISGTKFDWFEFPPTFYVIGLPLENGNLNIELDDDLSEGYEFALVMMEHYPVRGRLTYQHHTVCFSGLVDFWGGESYQLEIEATY